MSRTARPRDRRRRLARQTARWLATAGALASAGCGGGDSVPAHVAVDTMPSGVVRVRNAEPEPGRGPLLHAEQLVRIGELEGEEPYVFGRIHALTLGPDGRLYVLDTQALEIRIFDDRGGHVRTFGGRGGGPGELLDPRGMAWSPRGTLWVLDFPGNRRYTEFTPDGEPVATYPRAITSFSFAWEGRFDEAGHLYEMDFVADPAAGSSRQVLVRQAVRDGTIVPLDTFPVPERNTGSFYRAELPRGSSVTMAIPFAAQLHWVFDGRDAIWAGTGESYRLWQQRLAGDTVRILELARSPRPVTPEERARERERIDSIVRSRGGDPRQLDYSLIPAHRAAHGPLAVDDAGRIWVAPTPPAPSDPDAARRSARFDVFDEAGRLLGSITLGVSPQRPLAFGGGRVAGVAVDELDVERVVVYRVEALPPR